MDYYWGIWYYTQCGFFPGLWPLHGVQHCRRVATLQCNNRREVAKNITKKSLLHLFFAVSLTTGFLGKNVQHITLHHSLSLVKQNGEAFISLPQSLFNIVLYWNNLIRKKNIFFVNDNFFLLYFLTRQGWRSHRHRTTECRDRKGPRSGRELWTPAWTDRQTDISNDKTFCWLLSRVPVLFDTMYKSGLFSRLNQNDPSTYRVGKQQLTNIFWYCSQVDFFYLLFSGICTDLSIYFSQWLFICILSLPKLHINICTFYALHWKNSRSLHTCMSAQIYWYIDTKTQTNEFTFLSTCAFLLLLE